jgi:L-fuconolactonase
LRVDAHQHFWNLNKVNYPWLVPEYGPIYRTFEAQELEPQLHKAGIDKTIVVQAMNSYEDTNYMLETAAAFDWIGGVVGWVPLNKPDEAARKLEEYTANSLFKGVRHLIHEEKDPDWIIQPAVIEGLKLLAEFQLTFDVVAVFPNHLKHIPYLAEQVPNLRMVIDHLAKPPFKQVDWEQWAEQLGQAAVYSNVFAKISGLNTALSNLWPGQEIQRYVDYAYEKFSANRLMFGSDWPVAILNGDYDSVWRETLTLLKKYPQEAIDAILGGTAEKFYGITGRIMKRYGSVIKVKPEKFAEYKALHDSIWPNVVRTMHDCNIRNYTIFHKDGYLFSYYNYMGNDHASDMAKMAADPETQRWWALCGPCQDPLETRKKGEWWAEMGEIFHANCE